MKKKYARVAPAIEWAYTTEGLCMATKDEHQCMETRDHYEHKCCCDYTWKEES